MLDALSKGGTDAGVAAGVGAITGGALVTIGATGAVTGAVAMTGVGEAVLRGIEAFRVYAGGAGVG